MIRTAWIYVFFNNRYSPPTHRQRFDLVGPTTILYVMCGPPHKIPPSLSSHLPRRCHSSRPFLSACRLPAGPKPPRTPTTTTHFQHAAQILPFHCWRSTTRHLRADSPSPSLSTQPSQTQKPGLFWRGKSSQPWPNQIHPRDPLIMIVHYSRLSTLSASLDGRKFACLL